MLVINTTNSYSIYFYLFYLIIIYNVSKQPATDRFAGRHHSGDHKCIAYSLMLTVIYELNFDTIKTQS